MTDPKQVEQIYQQVIDDTISKLAPEFENAGVSLQTLARLREVWLASLTNAMRPGVPDTATHSQTAPNASARGASGSTTASSSNRSANGAASSSSAAPGSAETGAAAAASATSTTNGSSTVSEADSLRYTIGDPASAVTVKTETDPAADSSSAPVAAANGVAEAAAPSADQAKPFEAASAAPAPAGDEEEPESSDVSDDDEVDTSSWTNSLMSLYEEPTKRTKNKRTYKLVKGILNVGGRDYLFKSGKAEFEWR